MYERMEKKFKNNDSYRFTDIDQKSFISNNYHIPKLHYRFKLIFFLNLSQTFPK